MSLCGTRSRQGASDSVVGRFKIKRRVFCDLQSVLSSAGDGGKKKPLATRPVFECGPRMRREPLLALVF